MEEGFKNFCDNGTCPNHNLELNAERHYHIGSDPAFGGICGILRTHPYAVEIKTNYRYKGIFANELIYDLETKVYHFCDNCNSMLEFYKYAEQHKIEEND
jgi:hypothetical protein